MVQQNDPLWNDIILYLRERRVLRRRIPFPLDEFKLKDGLLYHHHALPERVYNIVSFLGL